MDIGGLSLVGSPAVMIEVMISNRMRSMAGSYSFPGRWTDRLVTA